MGSRAEITTKFAKAYAKASKKDKGRMLDEVVAVTGWSRDNARRRLTAAAKRPPGSGRQVAKTARKPRSPKYSYDALKVLQKVWAASGGQCGKYLAASRCGSSSTGWNATASWSMAATGTARRCVRSCCRCARPRSTATCAAPRPPTRSRGRLDHEALAAAADLDQDPQGR